jgi:hypothetical protein
MNRPSEHLERSLKICDLIEIAHKKQDEISRSPYYDIFGKPGERQSDHIKCTLMILRLQTWYYQSIQKFRECTI